MVLKLLLSLALFLLLVSSVTIANLPFQRSRDVVLSSAYADGTKSSVTGEPQTPMQLALVRALEEGKERGLEPESVSFTNSIQHLDNSDKEAKFASSASQKVSNPAVFKATTVIQFEGPRQAGLKEWPDTRMSVDDKLIESSKEEMATFLAKNQPDAYGERGKYEFGQEPRTLTIEESFVTQDVEAPVIAQRLDGSDTANVVMGFSKNQKIEYRRVETLSDPTGTPFATANMKISSRFDLTIRLPVTVKLDTPDVIEPSRDYFLKASLTPKEFNGAQYAALGLPEMKGQEFIATVDLDAEIILSVLGQDPVLWEEANVIDIAEFCGCSNFVTPFGLDEDGEPIPFLHGKSLQPFETRFIYPVETLFVSGKFGLGLRFSPDIDPKNITAKWKAFGDELIEPTSGKITFTSASPNRFSFGPLRSSGSGTEIEFGKTDVVLDDFRFNLDRFKIEYLARLQFHGTALGFGNDVVNNFFEIFEFNARSLVPEGEQPYIGQFEGTDGLTSELDVLSGAGVPNDCKPYRPARGAGDIHQLRVVNDYIRSGDNVRVVASLQGSSQVDQVRFLWYDANGDKVRERAKTPVGGMPGSVGDTYVDVYGASGSEWHVIACYEDKSSTLGLVSVHLDVASFSIRR